MADFSLQWHITQKCPNHCQHCYMDDSTHELSFDTYLKCIENIQKFEEAFQFSIDTITLTGGDPFLNVQWYKIAQDLINRGKRIAILGNPELLTDNLLLQLKQLPIISYQLSLDGMPVIHDEIRSAGSFDRTIAAIKKLSDCAIPICIMYTLSDKNVGDLFELIDYLDQLSIKIQFAFDFVISTGNANNNNMCFTGDKNKLFGEYLVVKQRLIDKNSKLTLVEKPSQLFAYRRSFDKCNLYKQNSFSMCGGCGAGWRHLTIVGDGDVLACRRMPIKIGNLLEESFESILLESPLLIKLRSRTSYHLCSTCLYYNYCRGCPAENNATNQDPFLTNLCPWYKEDVSSQDNLSEFEKIKNISSNRYYEIIDKPSHDFVKAFILLNIPKEHSLFIASPDEWIRIKKLSLSNEELDLLYCINLEKN